MKLKKVLFSFTVVGFLALLLWGLTACSTSKNNFPNRTYHNVTCKYNVLWNGQEALKQGEAELKKVSKDNFTSILPVYNYPDKADLGSSLSFFNRTIEKASKAIYKHSMLIHGKEYVKTIDDAYLIMGKAYFYKQDYVQAQRVLSYILHNFPESNSYNEAAVLLARTMLRQEYYASADEQLENLHYLATSKKNKKFNVLFNAAKAEYNLTAPDGDVQVAIDFLNDAIAAHPKREFLSRLLLIRGELYEKLGQQSEAQKNFMQVINKSDNYEMTFCAQMHLATNYDGTASSRNAIMKQFNKMLTEVKNKDYCDQIYYACSEIARIDENDTARVNYLRKSVAAYTNNNYQRTFSGITLADLYFSQNEYTQAQAYYDTATLTIPKNYPNYDQVMKKAGVLKDLVSKLDEIALQDSLQRIAKMSDGQRKAWVSKMIADYTEAERKAAAEEAERNLALQNQSNYANINLTSSNGKWYFYNQSLVTAGQQDFYRRFGNRKLEDNWFISNKQQISFDDLATMNDPNAKKDSVEYDEEGNPIAKRETDPKKEAYYLQDLPLTPGAIDSSNAIVSNDLYEVGFIYQDMLHDMPRANETFESLLKRFPNGQFALPCTYLLYSNYFRAKDSKYESYKNTILQQYPESDYAKLINDPNYYEKLAEKNKEMERKYESVYDAYKNKQWQTVVQAADVAIPQCSDKILKSKYAYLRAVASGQVFNQDTLIKGMSKIVADYADTKVADLARTYLSTFSKNQLSQNLPQSSSKDTVAQDGKGKKSETGNNPFVYKPSEMHYLILLVKSANVPVQTVKTNINNFNKLYFSLQHFNVSSFYINNSQQMVTIAKFSNAETATDYYKLMIKDTQFVDDIANQNIIIYVMSATNYTTFYNNQEGRVYYDDFFKQYYLKKE